MRACLWEPRIHGEQLSQCPGIVLPGSVLSVIGT